MFDRRRRRAAALFVLPIWACALAFATAGAGPVAASSISTPNSCTNTAQAGTSALPITVSGAATPNPAVAGPDAITLAGASFGIDVPGTILLAGYGLGLLTVGVNDIPAIVDVTIHASNTSEASATFATLPGPDGKVVNNPVTPADESADNVAGPDGFGLSIVGTTTITDPTPDNKTSGDETATPLSVSAPIPTTTWSPTGGDTAFTLGTSLTRAAVGGGFIVVTFTCTPGTPTPGGCGPAPAAPCTGTNPVPALPFSTVGVTGGGSTSSSSSTSSTTTTSTSSSSSSTTSTTSTSMPTSTTGGSTTSTTVSAQPVEVSGSADYTGTCTNSATPDVSELGFTVEGTTMSPVTAGSDVVLTEQTWTVTVPATVLQTGINLGLLAAGDSPGGTATVGVFASNTKEGTVTADPIALSIGPIALGSDGLAMPAATSFAVPDMSWTAVGGEVGFAMASAKIDVELGPLVVTFTCTPKNPDTTIVKAAVNGKTDIPPAGRPGTQVAGVTVTPAALPRTGMNPVRPIAAAVGLLDLGYLLVSATWPARRRLRHLVQ